MFVKSRELIHHVDVQGPTEAPVLVLLHSLGTNLHLWDSQMPTLTQQYRVLRLDMRGHGLTEVGQNAFSIEDLANDVLSIADSFGIGAFSVAGVSIGGLIAQKVADLAPERILSMVLIGTSLAPAASAFWHARAKEIRERGLDHLFEGIYSRWITPAFRDTPMAVGMLQMLYRTSPEGYAKCSEALAEFEFQPPKSTKVPALVLVGDQDLVFTPAAAQELATAREGKLVVLRDAAHIPILEKADEILEEMLNFLAETVPVA